MNNNLGPTLKSVGPSPIKLKEQPQGENEDSVPPVLPHSLGKSSMVLPFYPSLILLLAVLCLVLPAGAVDPYTTDELSPELNYYVKERNQRIAAEQQEQFRKRVSVRHAVGDDVFEAYVEKQKARIQTPAVVPLPLISNRALLIVFFAFLALILLVRRLAPELFVAINKKFNPWAQTAATVAGLSATVRAEDAAFSEFLAAFRTGPGAVAGTDKAVEGAISDRGLLMEFYANAPMALAALQKAIQEISQATKSVARQRLLAGLHHELRGLKGKAGMPELLPVWQMASALEGLVKQLSNKASEVNRSTLRTIAAGVDLLKELCVPGLQSDLLSNPPIRLLAVDDDLISRNAVTLALKKAFNPPDLAESGEDALALAMENAYDVVFLDVQMAGMDGYEVCTRIHGTAPNRNTPVVFVTCHSDFEARAQSTLCGGNDLIGKPFLTFEITVKALTLALQGRLSKRAQMASANESHELFSTASAKTKRIEGSPYGPQDLLGFASSADNQQDLGKVSSANPTGSDTAFTRRRFALPENVTGADTVTTSGELSSKDLLRAFLTRASTNLGPLRDLIQTLFRVTDENLRQEMLADFFLRFNALAPQSAAAEEHPALRLCTALEGLLTKMVGNPKHCTSSTLLTAATAVDLLLELCDAGVRPDLVTKPPIHMMVVDDDPVARRAVTGALQMSFEKPENADSGEAALHLATEKAFDAIFLDVEMPGMDGFAACLKIHETEMNRNTPVVFVTCHTDFKARSQSAVSGGSDLIAKPFLSAEIKVKALTFVMRGRLQKEKIAQHGKPAPREPESKKEELVPA